MKILLVGHHMPHYTHTNVYREKAIRELGHELIFFDDRDFMIPGRVRDRINLLQKWDFERLNNKLVNLVRLEKPDLCVVIGSRLTLPTTDTIKMIRATGARAVLWTTDPPHPHTFPFIERTAPFYDHVFCAGTEAMDILGRKGIKNVTWLPFACDPEYHRPVQISKEEYKKYAHDIAFVGAFYPNRWEILRELSEFDLGIWGPSWNLAADIERYRNDIAISDKKIDQSEWVMIYNATEIAIVIHFQDGKKPCYQASPKVYEALACGCFVLVDLQKDVFELFKDEVHLVYFDGFADLKEKVRHFILRRDQRLKIAQKGRQEVLEKHSYKHRIMKIIETVFHPEE